MPISIGYIQNLYIIAGIITHICTLYWHVLFCLPESSILSDISVREILYQLRLNLDITWDLKVIICISMVSDRNILLVI